MPKYKAQYKDSNGQIQDLDLLVKYDINGNQIDTTYALKNEIKNGLLTINVNDNEQEFYANSATDVYVEITLPRVKRYI